MIGATLPMSLRGPDRTQSRAMEIATERSLMMLMMADAGRHDSTYSAADTAIAE